MSIRGQWIGRFDRSGFIVLDIEAAEDGDRGCISLSAFDGPHMKTKVGRLDSVTEAGGMAKFGPFNSVTGKELGWHQIERVDQLIQVRSQKLVTLRRTSPTKMDISWMSDNGSTTVAELTLSQLVAESTLQPTQLSWDKFKKRLSQNKLRKFVYRGQNRPYKLCSAFHRTGRSDLNRYLAENVNALHRHLSGYINHFFDLTSSEEQNALLHLAQHHGFPTPLIDWSYSPFVAAYFAYKGTEKMSPWEFASNKVRIFEFDLERWSNDQPQIGVMAPVRPHFSLMDFPAMENKRMLPQQALSGITNIVDVESYIQWISIENGCDYLKAFDINANLRQDVMRDLAMMGVTAGSLFPGIEGICAELSERFFPGSR